MKFKLIGDFIIFNFLIISISNIIFFAEETNGSTLQDMSSLLNMPNISKNVQNMHAMLKHVSNMPDVKKYLNISKYLPQMPNMLKDMPVLGKAMPNLRGMLPAPLALPQSSMLPNNSTNSSKSYDCDKYYKYRTIDGSCNNLNHPSWGASGTHFRRLAGVNFNNDKNLMPAENVSHLCYPDGPYLSKTLTLMFMQFGQSIAHDLSLSSNGSIIRAYEYKSNVKHSKDYSSKDYPSKDHSSKDYSSKDQYSKDYSSKDYSSNDYPPKDYSSKDYPSEDDSSKNHSLKEVKYYLEQTSNVTMFLDLSNIYGSKVKDMKSLRAYERGCLKVDVRHNKEWLPQENNSRRACPLQDSNERCYRAGDDRLNQELQLLIIHILFYREHNRIAKELCSLNPHWDDEKLFQVARQINIGQYQHIVYDEWLPHLIGKSNAKKHQLIYSDKGHVDDYDDRVDPSVLNEFTTVAFRLHSLIAGKLSLMDEKRQTLDIFGLDSTYFRPKYLERNNNFDDLCRGLHTQCSMENDKYHVIQITEKLFRRDNQTSGSNLKATDIQRSRDHKISCYNKVREEMGLKKFGSFDELSEVIRPEDIITLKKIYKHINDLELPVVGSMEIPVDDAIVGPTFLHIIMKQFYNTRCGDKFFFQNGHCFTDEQICSLMNATISSIVCKNSNHIKLMQPKGFEKLSEENYLVPCETITGVDLTLWKEDKHSGGHGGDKYDNNKDYNKEKYQDNYGNNGNNSGYDSNNKSDYNKDGKY